jgi:hypothetical protein
MDSRVEEGRSPASCGSSRRSAPVSDRRHDKRPRHLISDNQ